MNSHDDYMERVILVTDVAPSVGARRYVQRLVLACGHNVMDHAMDSASWLGTSRECYQCAQTSPIRKRTVYFRALLAAGQTSCPTANGKDLELWERLHREHHYGMKRFALVAARCRACDGTGAVIASIGIADGPHDTSDDVSVPCGTCSIPKPARLLRSAVSK